MCSYPIYNFNTLKLLGFDINTYARSVIWGHKDRGFEIRITAGELKKKLRSAFFKPCPYCGCTYDLTNRSQCRPTVDIIDPKIRVLSEDNAQLTCERCNKTKGNMDHEQFVKARGVG
jgi:hypothetical protein